MDIYEFSQVLWRRKWILLAGFVALLVVVGALALDFSDGIKLRSDPKFEAQVQMAVVPEVFESLSQDLGGDSLSASANMFSSLLASPQAALEIQESEGVPVVALEVITSDRDRFFWVTALSTTPDGAVEAALGSFQWLEQRLRRPLLRTSVPTTSRPPKALLDDEGKFRSSVVLDLDHALATDTDGLWLVAQTDPNDEFAFRLADAADDTSAEYTSLLTPGEPISLVLEDAAGSPLDTTTVAVPSLPSDEAPEEGTSYRLIVSLDRGLVRGTVVDPELDGIRTIQDPEIDAQHVRLDWEPTTESVDQGGSDDPGEVSILLLSDDPVPVRIGGRKTPLLVIAVMTAGMVALIVSVVVVDSWIQERRRRSEGEDDDSPTAVTQSILPSSQKAPGESRRMGS